MPTDVWPLRSSRRAPVRRAAGAGAPSRAAPPACVTSPPPPAVSGQSRTGGRPSAANGLSHCGRCASAQQPQGAAERAERSLAHAPRARSARSHAAGRARPSRARPRQPAVQPARQHDSAWLGSRTRACAMRAQGRANADPPVEVEAELLRFMPQLLRGCRLLAEPALPPAQLRPHSEAHQPAVQSRKPRAAIDDRETVD